MKVAPLGHQGSVIWLVFFLALLQACSAIHLQGTFSTSEFFKFIARFGFQKTDIHNEEVTTGYIYGNFTVLGFGNQSVPADSLITLSVMDYNYFIDYYNNRVINPKTSACSMMFEKLNKIAYFFECNEKGKEDFIRRIPCEKDKVCIDEDNQLNVIDGNQFTFRIRDLNQARFWYISVCSCNRNLKTCTWSDLSSNSSASISSYTIAYDIWVVNGNPEFRGYNRFEHHYTYELHDIFELYLTSFVALAIIAPFVAYRLKKFYHPMLLQLFVYICFELVCRIFSLIHNSVFSYDGKGIVFFEWVANFLEAFDSSILVLILISIAKGWTVRTRRLKTNKNFYIMGFILLVVLVTSHMVSLSLIDPVFNTNSYETTAGYVELSVRFLWMIWYLFELKNTFDNLETVAYTYNSDSSIYNQFYDVSDMQVNEIDREPDDGDDTGDLTSPSPSGKGYSLLREDSDHREERSKQDRLKLLQIFYLHFGACSLVWFIYMPVLVFITSFVSELYRIRLVLGIRYLINYFSVLLLCFIMWTPSTPLKLPGKIPTVRSDIVSRYLFFEDNVNDNEQAEAVLFSREAT